LTADIDVVLVLRLPDIPALQSAFPETEYYVPPAETMREGGSDKHLRDIRFMLAATPVDRVFIASEVARRGLAGQWLKSAGGQ
jgi:hypothetical protein